MLRPLLFPVLIVVAGCADPDANVIRGKGLKVAELTPAEQAQMYRSMTGVAFDLRSAGLVFMAHPLMLPRLKDSAGDPVPGPLLTAMQSASTVVGVCEPQVVANHRTPRCPSADSPGYLLRFSDVLIMPHDTMVAYMEVEKYDTPAAPSVEPIRFERAYKLVKKADGWTAVSEGRVPAGD
jgi:hypothetical protein